VLAAAATAMAWTVAWIEDALSAVTESWPWPFPEPVALIVLLSM